MTVRTKAGLASQIATLLADNDLRDISEADARSVVTDVVDSMALESALTPGAVGSGMPTFSAGALTYDGAANEITGDLTNFAAMPPLPSLIVAIMPADIDRQAEDLRMTLNLRDFALQNVAGDPVRARDLTPGCAHLILRSSAGYRLLDPLGPRPQDFTLAVGWVHLSQTPPLQAEIDAMLSLDVARFGLDDLNDSAHPAAPNTRDYLWMGVPPDAPDILALSPVGGRDWPISPIDTTVLGDPMFDGVQYRWWRTDSTVDLNSEQDLVVIYAPYS